MNGQGLKISQEKAHMLNNNEFNLRKNLREPIGGIHVHLIEQQLRQIVFVAGTREGGERDRRRAKTKLNSEENGTHMSTSALLPPALKTHKKKRS